MKTYCTLFDMNYFPKWYVMYRSWLRWCGPEDVMYVLPLDKETNSFLRMQGEWPQVKLVGLDVLQEDLKGTRTYPEWCWTHAPVIVNALLEKNHSFVTYLDADLYFMGPLSDIWGRIQNNSVAVVPHNFAPEHAERLRPSGLFNVSWVTFKQDPAGRRIARRWESQVKKKCDAESCGDQKYLDEWPNLLGRDLCILDSAGIGVAPWNASRYSFVKSSATPLIVLVKSNDRVDTQPLIFYHFHELKRKPDKTWYLTGYQLPTSCIQGVYTPYLRELEAAYGLMDVMKVGL